MSEQETAGSSPTQEFYFNDPEWAKELEQGVVEYMDTLLNGIYEDLDTETLTGTAFCGCDTCFWREALTFITPRIIRAYKANQVVLVEDED